jgi:hypothetical protein
MAVLEMQAAPLLSGSSDDLAPVVFLTGGSQAGTGSYPSLRLDLELPPDVTKRMTWTHAALNDPEGSFNLARSIAARPWDAEVARLDLSNAGLIDIHTGNPDWDAAFALSQKTAFGLFVGPTPHLPSPSFVTTRLPDQGYSLRGDGSDYNHLWNGQSPLEAYYLSGMILPGAPELAQGIVRNYLSVQTEDGSIDWKPGLAGQRSRLLATPLLATLTWKIYEYSGDRTFLAEAFPGLWSFVQSWFGPEQDRDGDGIPEWNHPMQTGFDDHPTFSRWNSWSQGVDITTAESPALCAFLYRECQSLLDIAAQLDRREPVSALHSMAEHLRTALDASWSQEAAAYRYWDRDSHVTTQGEKLGERMGPGSIRIERSFEHPVRLFVEVKTSGEATRPLMVSIRGEGAGGQPRVETVGKDRFKWFMGTGNMTGERVYSRLEQVDIQGLEEGDLVELHSVGYGCLDQTTLLPLWACVPDRERAELLIQRTILSPDSYWMPYGIPACPGETACLTNDTGNPCQGVHLPWNTLIGEGLLRYGFQTAAAEIVTRAMAAIVQTLKQERGFRRFYHAESGQGYGERNALSGLAPLGLFMETLGVRVISPQRVALHGFNPFPWPITVKYRGITVLRQKESSTVIFPDGQTVEVEDPAPRIVSLERV